MKNLKLLCRNETKLPSNITHFTTDNETSKFYIAYLQYIEGYNFKNFKQCFSIDLANQDGCNDENNVEIMGLQFICGEEQLCIALKHGDVMLCGTMDAKLECVGSVDCELLAMSWSPDQEIVLFVTSRGSVVAMTHDFDPITEIEVSSVEFGEGTFVNVGWGSNETQFQGSAGKFIPGKQTPIEAIASAYDDNQTNVIWRGDGQYFAISSMEQGKRKFRVWNRECELQYTSQDISGLESAFAWKPSGALIASTQRKVHRHDVVFFELNGLQHGEFTLPFHIDEVIVNKLEWNCDSSVLLLLATNAALKQTYMQLWTTSNYHWFLKQNVQFDNAVSWASWDTEEPLNLHMILHNGLYYLYRWAFCIDGSGVPVSYNKLSDVEVIDSSYVAVIDGTKVNLTPFKHMTVPPPMCAFHIHFKEFINAVCFLQSPSDPDHMGVFTSNGVFTCLMNLQTCTNSDGPETVLMAAGGNGFSSQISPLLFNARYEIDKSAANGNYDWSSTHHLLWINPNILVAVASIRESDRDCLLILKLVNETSQMSCEYVLDMDDHVTGLCVGQPSGSNVFSVIIQLNCGRILQYAYSTQEIKPFLDCTGTPVCLNSLCPKMCLCLFEDAASDDCVYGLLALSVQKRLFLNNIIISSDCTSFAVHDDYILYTSSTHKLICISRNTSVGELEKKVLKATNSVSANNSVTEIIRSVERGASLIMVTPSDTKTIMQLPRGNLEQIHPRALAMSVVKHGLDNSKYKSTFQLMRKHRINMNLIHDHNPTKFFQELSTFIEQLNCVDHLNLFLSDLKEEDVTVTMYNQNYPQESQIQHSLLTVKESKVDKICEAMLAELQDPNYYMRYFLSVLTAHVKKSKAEIDLALGRVKSLKENHSLSALVSVHDALQYLHILVDSRILYQEALATYDLDLALMVAEMSHNDPKEYVPFLNDLKSLEENFRKYKIDLFLKKYDRALVNICKCTDHFSDCIDLVKSHNLHREALELFKRNTTQYRDISSLYAEFLTGKHLYEEAGIILMRCKNYKRAIKCFLAACCWQHALNSAIALHYSKQEYTELAKSLGNALTEKCRFTEAAMVLEQEANDSKSAIMILCKGHLWASALHLILKHDLKDLTDTCLIPSLEEALGTTLASIQSLRERFDRYFTRLLKVREIKEESRRKQLLDGDGDLDSDIASDFGSIVTSSSVSSVNSRTSQRTAKSRRKQERKQFSLREGSRFEEEGLLQALQEIIKNFVSQKDDIHSLIEHLSLFHMDKGAKQLQQLHKSTLDLFTKNLPKIWVEGNSNSLNSSGPYSTANSIILSRAGTTHETWNFAKLELAVPPKIDSKSTCGMHIYFDALS